MTARTIEYPHIQGHLLPMSADAACLTCIGRVDSNRGPASFFRFAGQFPEKFRPRGIGNALRQTMIVNHAVHMKVFHTDRTEAVDDLPGLLMREVIPPEPSTLMDSCLPLTVLPTKRSTLGKLRMLALHFGQGFLFLAEKAGIGYLFSIAESGECLQSNVNTYLGSNGVKPFRFTLTRKADVPFPCRGTLHGTGFYLPLDLAMVDHLDSANLGESDTVIMRGRPGGCPGDRDNGDDAKATLREGETVVAVMTFEAWVTWLLSMFSHSSKEC